MIRLAIDFTNAQSYLALAPTIALADELGVSLHLLPYRVDVASTRGAAADAHENAAGAVETKGERHARVRAEYNETDLARYAKRLGVELTASTEGVDSTVALAGLLWANRANAGIAYAADVFRDFWRGELDVADAQTIGECLRAHDAPGFDADASVRELQPCRDELTEAGVFSVPMYVVEGQTFLGRQHLPMIRWLLTGEQGQPPI